MKERKTVIQLVGNAHLGIEPGNNCAVERIEKLSHYSDAEVALELCTNSRSESGHESPALMALVRWMAAQGWSGQTIDLLLIAVAQDPPHASDTAPIAELIERAIPELPSVLSEEYPQIPRIELQVIRIEEMKITSVASTITCALRTLTNVEHVSLVVGPGSVALQAGIFLGCIGAAVRPEIIELNRQDKVGKDMVVNLQTTISFQRWLARTGRYGTLSKLNTQNDDEHAANMVKILAAAVALDWPEARKLALRFERLKNLLCLFPNGDNDVDRLCYWTAFAIRARLAAHDRYAYLWVPRLAQNEFKILSNEHTHAVGAIQRAAKECTSPDCGAKEYHCPLTVKTVMRCQRLQSYPMPAEIEALRKKLEPVWKQSNRVRHKGAAEDLEPLQRYLNSLDLDASPDENLPRFGLPVLDTPKNAGQHEKHLVLVAVGYRFWDDRPGSPFLDALNGLTSEETHTVFLASTKSKELKPDDLAIDDFITVSDEAIRSVDQCIRALREHFRREPLAFSTVHVGVGPGTQAMNLALLVAGVEFSYETGARLKVHQLLEDGSVPARTSVVSMTTPDVRELAPRVHIAAAMEEAARVVDLAQLLELIELAPANWREKLKQPAKELLDKSFNRTTSARARLGLAREATKYDLDRGLLWGFAILEEKNPMTTEAERSRSMKRTWSTLRNLRNDRIHSQVTTPPASDKVRDLFQEAGSCNDLLKELNRIKKIIKTCIS